MDKKEITRILLSLIISAVALILVLGQWLWG